MAEGFALLRTLAKYMNIDFKPTNVWLWCFCKHCGIMKRGTFGESLSASAAEIVSFRKCLNELIEKEGLILCLIYNADETTLFWQLLLKTQRPMHMKACS
jgi:hypothetical protein